MINWDKIESEVIKKLDSIDLLKEMEDGSEPIYDFMNRLEEKYPFECETIVSLFDGFGSCEFDDYLRNRYSSSECRIEEYIRVDVIKVKKE